MFKKIAVLIFISVMFFAPSAVPVFAQGNLIPCNGVVDVTHEGVTPGTERVPNIECGFPELMKLINNLITFLLFYIATPIAAIVFAYAGWTFMTSGGDEKGRSKAKGMFVKVLLGYILALAAWLLVKTIMVELGYDATNFQSFY
jgi:hypothetical protein